jgi:tetratricopeptide (TPR) repeat protein
MRVVGSLLAALLVSSCGSQSPGASAGANVQALTSAAQSARNAGDWQGCIAKYSEAIAATSASVTAYVGRAGCYMNVGNLSAAVHDYSQAINLSPDDPNLYLLRAAPESGLGNMSSASADYKKLSTLASANQEELVQAAEGLGESGSLVEALALLNDALKRYGNSWDLHRYSAVVESRLGADNSALLEFAAAAHLATGVDLAIVLGDRADFYLLRQQYQLAIRDYDQAIRLDNSQYRYRQQRARARVATGDLPGGQVDYTAAVDIYRLQATTDPDILAQLFIERGKLFQQQGLPQKALADFRQALAVSRPSNTPQRAIITKLIAALSGS